MLQSNGFEFWLQFSWDTAHIYNQDFTSTQLCSCVVTLVYEIRMFKVNKFDNKYDLFTGSLFTV